MRGFPAIKAYSVVERHGFVWAWPGDAAQVDASRIPALEWHDHPDWAYGGGLHHIKADCRLMIGNLMDLTPETETSMWYFWGMARKFKPHDQALTAQIREGQGRIFGEDLEMLERQQQNLLDWPERKLLMLNIDAGGVQSRRILDRLIAQERAGAAAPAALPTTA